MIDPWKALKGLKQFSCYQPPDRTAPDPEKEDVERRLWQIERRLEYLKALQLMPQFDVEWAESDLGEMGMIRRAEYESPSYHP
jgi:hypothetical protein